ncbi:DUF5719 family protein [Streptomyces harbinensis]|uniref:DUF5719 family protein n=1 Tax=Streptomyces harbinensis TaxID=1176198 RepID=UPI0034DF8634
MNRTTISLLATVTALVAVTGVASLGSGEQSTAPAGQARDMPVERTALTCPRPTGAELATTEYTAYTPGGDGNGDGANGQEAGEEGHAYLLPAPEYVAGFGTGDEDEDSDEDADQDPEPLVALQEPGVPVSASVDTYGAPALTGTAEQRLAPGWTVQQTTSVRSGAGQGLLGTSCQTPDSEFWFAGASTAEARNDYVHLTNPDAGPTVVDIQLYGPEGRLESELGGEGVTVPGGTSVAVRLSTLTDEPLADLAVQVTARTGRIGAQIEASDAQLGVDWLTPVSATTGPLVLPGIPADARTLRLVAYAPGDEDVALDVSLSGPTGSFTPAGNESITLRSRTLTAIDLEDLTQGEPGSLILTPATGSGAGAVVVGLRVTQGEDDEREMAFIPATAPIEQRASVAGNTAKGTTLSLVAPEEAVEVRVTLSGGSNGGEVPEPETYTVEARSTLAIAPELPDGTKGRYAITVERLDGGTLYASRTLVKKEDDMVTFTVQTLPDDRSRVSVPQTGEDLSVLTD